jgi:thiosulfate/3-mercaptopyruvate sulfurtransferase
MEDVTLEELHGLLESDGVLLLDVRTPQEFDGVAGAHCDPRQGHIPGAVNLPLDLLFGCSSADDVRALVGAPEGADIVAYCHVGNRSRLAVQVLDGAGFRARNYVGSWHEWARVVPEPPLTPA